MKMGISFLVDRELSAQEKNALLDALYLQLKEPQDADGNDETYSTKEIAIWFKEGE